MKVDDSTQFQQYYFFKEDNIICNVPRAIRSRFYYKDYTIVSLPQKICIIILFV